MHDAAVHNDSSIKSRLCVGFIYTLRYVYGTMFPAFHTTEHSAQTTQSQTRQTDRGLSQRI